MKIQDKDFEKKEKKKKIFIITPSRKIRDFIN